MRTVTVVLPAAGGGSRLGLPFPKELAPLGPGRVVLDSCLDLIRASGVPARVVLLEDGRREATASRIRARLPGVPLALVRQDPGAADWPEAVLQLGPWLSGMNVLLFPDAVYEAKGDAVGELARLQEQGAGFVFAVADAAPGEVTRLGAVRVSSGGRVADYADKPADPAGFGAVWGAIWFCGKTGLAGIEVVAGCTRGSGQVHVPVLGAPVTWLARYADLGIWDAYLAEISRGTS